MKLNRFAAVSAMLVVTPFFAKQLGAQGFDPQDSPVSGQHTSGVIARVDIGAYPVGCGSSLGNPTDANPWTNKSGLNQCSVATEKDNVDGLMILVDWSTLQPKSYDEPLSSYYIDNAIYALAHPERQHIHLAVLAGTHSPKWLIDPPLGVDVSFPDKYGNGNVVCNPADPSAGGPNVVAGTLVPGTIWNVFSFGGKLLPMPNPFKSNTCLFTALDHLVYKLGQSGDYRTPKTSPYPQPLAPYDDLYYDSAAGSAGFVHTNQPTATMNKIIGHVSVLGPHSYDGESVLCQYEADCRNTPGNKNNYDLWVSLQPDDSSMETAIENAQKLTIDIYANYFPNTYWTTDLVEQQMPFFTPDGCNIPLNPYPPTPAGTDASDCFGKLRTDLIDYIQTRYSSHGGVQNNSLEPDPNGVNSLDPDANGVTDHPVWLQTALAAQEPPINPVKLFVGLQVGAPGNFYRPGDSVFADFEADDLTAVYRAEQMSICFQHVDFIEFYDVDIASNFTLPTLHGNMSNNSQKLNSPASALNDDPGGFMHDPLTKAHLSLRRPIHIRPCSKPIL
jgi:hypothetical protein